MRKILVAVTLMTVFAACTKSDEKYYRFEDAVGVWQGKYSNSIGANPTQDWLMVLKSDSTMLIYNSITDTANASRKGHGRFSTYDNSVVIVFQWGNDGGYFANGEITPSKDRITGVWGVGNQNRGDFIIDKR